MAPAFAELAIDAPRCIRTRRHFVGQKGLQHFFQFRLLGLLIAARHAGEGNTVLAGIQQDRTYALVPGQRLGKFMNDT